MPIQYKNPKHAFFTEGESLTEQEHKDSCDINKMLKQAARGLEVRGNPSPAVYGYDDTTLDGLTHRINKENLERELRKSAEIAELSEEELKTIPESIKKQFGFKIKKQKTSQVKNDEQNDKKNSEEKINKNLEPKKSPSQTSSSEQTT